MAQPSRTAQIVKIHKVLKKYYKPVNPEPNRSVIEQLLFACCLENAPYDAAEEAFAALSHNFFDWNEVRVSTVRELAEEMPRLPDPSAAAQRIKRVLQSIFDATYGFDLEDLRKLNLGPATEKLAKLDGTTSFSVAYVVQAALGGHAIPVDQGVIKALEVADMITPEEIPSCQIHGLERAVAKPKGFEFASLLHQLGADFIANPQSPAVLQILLDLNPAAAELMTKRRPKTDHGTQSQPAAKNNVAAGENRPPQADATQGTPEVKKSGPRPARRASRSRPSLATTNPRRLGPTLTSLNPPKPNRRRLNGPSRSVPWAKRREAKIPRSRPTPRSLPKPRPPKPSRMTRRPTPKRQKPSRKTPRPTPKWRQPSRPKRKSPRPRRPPLRPRRPRVSSRSRPASTNRRLHSPLPASHGRLPNGRRRRTKSLRPLCEASPPRGK